MKKLLLILLVLLIAVPCIAGPGMKQLQDGILDSTPVCTKDTSNLVMDESTMSADAIYQLNNDGSAVGQSVSYGSAWSSYSIATHFSAATLSCVYTIRIGTSNDLTTYTEEIANQNAPDGGGIHEVVLTSNSFSASTSYYVGYSEVSGDCRILQDSTTPPYAGGSWIQEGTGWVMGAPATSRDNHINFYKCQ